MFPIFLICPICSRKSSKPNWSFAIFLFSSRCCLLVELLLRLLHQRHHVAHAQDAAGHAVRVELVQRLHLLARADELDRLVHHAADRERRTAARIAVELGEHHAVDVQALVEGLRRVHRVLTGHGVHHEERLLRVDRLLDRGDLVHHLLIDRQAAGGIDDHGREAVLLRVRDRVLRDAHRILVLALAVHFDLQLLAQRFQLVDGRGTVHVGGGEQHALALFADVVGQFAAEGGLTRPLQAAHQHHRGVAAQVDARVLPAHQLGQLVVRDLGEQLAGAQRS